jgi:hypothetical protein
LFRNSAAEGNIKKQVYSSLLRRPPFRHYPDFKTSGPSAQFLYRFRDDFEMILYYGQTLVDKPYRPGIVLYRVGNKMFNRGIEDRSDTDRLVYPGKDTL